MRLWSSKVSQIAFSYNFQTGGAMTKDGTTLPASRIPKKDWSPGEEENDGNPSVVVYITDRCLRFSSVTF